MDLVLDFNCFSFSTPNPNPNPTHLPQHQTMSPNHQFSQRIWCVEYYSCMRTRREVRKFAWRRSEMITVFARLVNAVMSVVAPSALSLRLCPADNSSNLKVSFIGRNDLLHNLQCERSTTSFPTLFAVRKSFILLCFFLSYHRLLGHEAIANTWSKWESDQTSQSYYFFCDSFKGICLSGNKPCFTREQKHAAFIEAACKQQLTFCYLIILCWTFFGKKLRNVINKLCTLLTHFVSFWIFMLKKHGFVRIF